MCDYSLEHLASRPAKVGDKLTLFVASTNTRGFCREGEENTTATCLLPGTELAFAEPIRTRQGGPGLGVYCDYGPELPVPTTHTTAIFRQTEEKTKYVHKDAIELPDGTVIPLMLLYRGQHATVLQLPVEEKVEEKPQSTPVSPELAEATENVLRELAKIV